jgi:hypothetical protein
VESAIFLLGSKGMKKSAQLVMVTDSAAYASCKIMSHSKYVTYICYIRGGGMAPLETL